MRSKLFSCGLLAVLLAVVPAGAAAQDAGSESVPASEDPEVRALLGAGWAFLEMGSLRKADEAFKAALEHPLGRSCAETYFGLAGVWWERRNAMAAYQRLQEAQAASAGNFRWDPGAGGAWDARIEARMRFIERNFTVIQLKFEGRKVLPPLADPQPTDPLLLEFGQRLPAVLDEHIEAGASTLWLLLPNGGWWVGDSLEELGGGEMNPARASAWRLPRARGAAARTHGERVAALARGESPAAELRGRTPADPAGSTEVRAEDSSSTPEAGASVAGGDGEVLEGRRFYVAVGGGGVTVGSQQEGDPGLLAGTLHGEAGLVLRLGSGVALPIGLSFTHLPVSLCSSQQARADVVALHAGPRFSRELRRRLWLSGQLGLHLGVGIAERGAALRERCAEESQSLGSPGEPRFGAVLSEGERSGTVSYADLGWKGSSFVVGPQGAIGFLAAPGASRVYLGASLFLRYDQVFAILEPGRRLFTDADGLGSMELGALSGAASMTRIQFGLRAEALF